MFVCQIILHTHIWLAACGGMFRNADADFLGAFSVNLGVSTALHFELIAAMVAIEIAHVKNWQNLWLETDSMLVLLAFKSAKIVPWSLRNRWDNCMFILSMFNFNVSHIYIYICWNTSVYWGETWSMLVRNGEPLEYKHKEEETSVSVYWKFSMSHIG